MSNHQNHIISRVFFRRSRGETTKMEEIGWALVLFVMKEKIEIGGGVL